MDMDAAYRRKAAGKRRRAPRHAAGRRDAGSRDRRRLVQLLVSLALFLLVFVGRGVFPRQIEVWRGLLNSDTDFQAAFRSFSQSISQGEGVSQALRELGGSVFGGEKAPEPAPEETRQPEQISLLSQTRRLGLSYSDSAGVLADRAQPSQPSAQPEPEATAEVVTAVAQAYDESGAALPSNVSMIYYPLGLEETAVPVHGTVTSGFGYRVSPITGKEEFHLALDIAAAEGTQIGAFADGVVEYIGESDEFGLYLKLNHANGVSSFYAHCSKLLVRKGDEVKCGESVALVGDTGKATGTHLHLTIEKDHIRLDPAYYVDPS